MTEVIKNQETNSSDWSSLTELRKDEGDGARTTWDDLASSESFETIQSQALQVNSEKIEPLELSDMEIQRLDAYDQILYSLNPVIYTQMQQLKPKSRHDDDGLKVLRKSLARHIDGLDYASHGKGKEYRLKNESLEKIAEIYGTLGIQAEVLTGDILEMDADRISSLKQYFDTAAQELPLEVVAETPREGLMRRILNKLHGSQRPETNKATTQEVKKRNGWRKDFLLALINKYPPA